MASAVDCDVILCSVSGRTGVAIAPDTVAALAAEHANIVGIKEAGGDAARVTAIRTACGPWFLIHSSDDGLALPF